jgi:hypothetical protein
MVHYRVSPQNYSIIMHEIKYCDDALKKDQHIESDDDWTTSSLD